MKMQIQHSAIIIVMNDSIVEHCNRTEVTNTIETGAFITRPRAMSLPLIYNEMK